MARLPDLIHQHAFASPAHEAVLSVLVTYPWVMGTLARVMAPHGITPAQYNALRILRGRHPEPATCAYIGERLLDRTPDVTRLLDRLVRAGLVTRRRAAHDRRVAEITATDRALELLRRLDPEVETALRQLTEALSDDELRTLSVLLEKLRAAQAP